MRLGTPLIGQVETSARYCETCCQRVPITWILHVIPLVDDTKGTVPAGAIVPSSY
jgi:hypothetical protein